MSFFDFQIITEQLSDFHTVVLLAISALFIGSFLVFYISNYSRIPSFVIAIIIGILFAPLLHPITDNLQLLSMVIGLSATLILFSGGLEIPFNRFKKIVFILLLLSTIGVLLSTGLFGLTLHAIAPLFDVRMPIGIAILLGAILASTDPTILIPMMKKLRFKSDRMKDIIIGESATTDVTGALLVILMLEILAENPEGFSLAKLTNEFFSPHTGLALTEHTVLGIIFGVIGAGLLIALGKLKTQDSREYDVDAAFFLFVPITIYALATAVGGSGLLAAFIAGLLFQTTEFLDRTEKFFNHIIDGFLKPAIFILLGAIVPIDVLFVYAPIGIAISVIFILLIRPIALWGALIPKYFTKNQLTWKELAGLSAVRETGAVPAVLLMSTVAIPGIGSDALLAIGLWVIITTILIPPAITPWLFDQLGIAERIPWKVGAHLKDQDESFIVLASRGGSFKRRLPQVTEWALKHDIHRIGLLLCLEDKYSQDHLEERMHLAKQVFERLQEKEVKAGHKITFFPITTDGYLHDAIRSLPKQSSHVVAVFVGKKMLDFHLEEIQNLGTPLYFID